MWVSKMTLYDLGMFFASYFLVLLVLIVLYGLIDMMDKHQRKVAAQRRHEEEMLVQISDEPCEYDGIWITNEPDEAVV